MYHGHPEAVYELMSAPVREVVDAHRGSKKQRTLSVQRFGSATDLHLKPCKHQVSLGKARHCHAACDFAGARCIVLTCRVAGF